MFGGKRVNNMPPEINIEMYRFKEIIIQADDPKLNIMQGNNNILSINNKKISTQIPLDVDGIKAKSVNSGTIFTNNIVMGDTVIKKTLKNELLINNDVNICLKTKEISGCIRTGINYVIINKILIISNESDETETEIEGKKYKLNKGIHMITIT